MQLHGQAVLNAHARHFHDYMAGEKFGVFRRRSSCNCFGKQFACFSFGQVNRMGRQHALIRGGRSHLFKESPALLDGLDKAAITGAVDSAHFG